jgi:hypothetical protein
MSQRVSAVFKRNLSEQQFEQYQQVRRQAAETRAGQLWIQSADGDINPLPVRFGISDDKYTQLFGANVKDGDVVVTRIRAVKKDR